MFFKQLSLTATTLILTACVGVTQSIKYSPTDVLTQNRYLQTKSTHGVVLMDVNWGRYWNCGNYENAQLLTLAFDKLPVKATSNEVEADFVLQSPSRLMVKPEFINYAYALEPGEYAISGASIKIAKSVSDVRFSMVRRDKLFKNGVPVGGTFVVKPGEVVFIGNFYLDCTYEPILWRYHSDGKKAFEAQIEEYQSSFPFLDLKDVKFRLFKTTVFGHDYELAD